MFAPPQTPPGIPLQKQIDDAVRDYVHSVVAETYFEAEAAVMCGAVLANNSSLVAATLRLLDGREKAAALPRWQIARQVQFPTLEGLTPSQVVALRHEAKDALPAFRQRLFDGLMNEAGTTEQADVAAKNWP